ncbi:MAG TPA: nucleotidyltransferase domain-containing protein [Thermodesulfobacteriota bacterium]|nr:nucleotidyltransferase domain-containing protein [Thermodesulfobacteriota bacterium]
MSARRREIKNIIKRFEAELIKLNIRPQKIILFGSYANGTPREDRDIDLAVISKDFKNLNVRERLDILGLAAGRVFEPIEALGYTPEELKHVNPVSILSEALASGAVITLK